MGAAAGTGPVGESSVVRAGRSAKAYAMGTLRPSINPEQNILARPGLRYAAAHMTAQKSGAWFVYVARCADGTLYTGVARDVRARIAAHDAGRGARYTRGRGPLTVCAVRRCVSKSDALRLERAIKRLPRASKETLSRGRRLAALARRCAVAQTGSGSTS